MSLVDYFAQPLARLLTAVLFHFVWQAALIAVLLVLAVEFCGIRRAASRYATSLIALVAMALCPLITAAFLWSNSQTVAINESIGWQSGFPSLHSISDAHSFLLPISEWLETAQPYALVLWFVGVTMLASRLIVGAIGLEKLRRGRLLLPAELAQIVERLGKKLHIEARSLVFLSCDVAEAMAVGMVRPLVLIPAAWMTEMPLPMLEAVIAHELAHLRRHDLWINLFQRVVETLLFYHPAVWWLSHRLRVERELCCDELAVHVTGQRLLYVQALETVALQRAAHVEPALGALMRGEKNMRLLQRVRNLLGQSPTPGSRLWPAGLLALAFPLGLWLASVAIAPLAADDERDDEGPRRREQRIEIRETKPKVELKLSNKFDRDLERDIQTIITRKIERAADDDDDDKPATKKEAAERKVPLKVGKPTVELQFADRPVNRDARQIEELASMVNRLSAQVKELQAEVRALRESEAGSKGIEFLEKPKPARIKVAPEKRATEEREEVEIRERKIGTIPNDIGNDIKKRAMAEAELAKAAALRMLNDKEAIVLKARELAEQKKEEAMKKIIEQKRSAEREEAEALKRIEIQRREADRDAENRVRERQRERDRDAREREERKRDEQREERDRERPNPEQ